MLRNVKEKRKGEPFIYRILNARKRQRQDLNQLGVFKDSESNIKQRLVDYHEHSLNLENKRGELEEMQKCEGTRDGDTIDRSKEGIK